MEWRIGSQPINAVANYCTAKLTHLTDKHPSGLSAQLPETFGRSLENLVPNLDSLALSSAQCPISSAFRMRNGELEWQRLGKQGSLQACAGLGSLGLCIAALHAPRDQLHLAFWAETGPHLGESGLGSSRLNGWLREKLRGTAF